MMRMDPYFANESTTFLPFGEERSQVVIPIVMCILQILGNGLAIFCLIRYKRRGEKVTIRARCSNVSRDPNFSMTDAPTPERRPTGESRAVRPRKRLIKFGMFHTFVFILAVMDLFGSICTTPITVSLYLEQKSIEDFGGRGLCLYSAIVMMTLGFFYMAMVMAMAIERFFSIRYAFLYHQKASSNKAIIVAVVILVVGVLFSSMPVFGFGSIKPMEPYSWCFMDWTSNFAIDKAFNYIYASFGFLMLLTALFCNVMVIKGLIHMRRRLSSCRSSRHGAVTHESQMIVQLLFITVIYIVCWLPLLLCILLHQLGYSGDLAISDRAAIWLAIVHPILDPWVYILCRNSVLQGVKRRIKKFACIGKLKTATPGEEMHYLTIKCSPRLEKLKPSS